MKSLTSRSLLGGALALLAVLLLAVGCSSSSDVAEPAVVIADDAAATTRTPAPRTPAPRASVAPQAQAQPASNLPAIAQVAPELAGLGTLIAVHSAPVQQTFDGTGGSLTLADGALVQVPSDSFPAPTNVDMVVTDLLFGKYLDDAPQGRIYRLATVEEVTLLRPMVLEIAKPAESVTVLMLEDGVWTEQTIPDLDTTRVEITHFSANHVAVIDKAVCVAPAYCTSDTDYVDYKLLNPHRSTCDLSCSGFVAKSSTDLVWTMTEAEFAACKGLCPSRTAPDAPAQGSTDQASTDQGSTADSATTRTPAAAPPAAAAPSTSGSSTTTGGSSQPAPAETTTSNEGCQSPLPYELERNGSKSCVSEAVCISNGFGWKAQNGKCTGPPPCASDYSRDNSGTCRSPIYSCAHPQLDYPHLAGCITPQNCAPSSDGYTISGSKCDFFEGDCDFGYVWNGSKCVTLSMGCEYPLVDFLGVGQSDCISGSRCEQIGAGWYYVDGKCFEPEEISCDSGYFWDGSDCVMEAVYCESGYFYDGFNCVTPVLSCSYPNVEFSGVGQQECLSPSACTAVDGGGWFTDTGLCLKA